MKPRVLLFLKRIKMENQTITECEDTLSPSQEKMLATFAWWLDTPFYLVVGLIGFTLNTLAMWILLMPTMWSNFFNRILLCLSAYDSAFILCGLLEIFRKWLQLPVQQYLFAHLFYPFRSMAMCCSIYTTLVLTLERYQAITSPIQYRNRSAHMTLGKRLFIYVAPVMLLSFLYYLPKFFDLYIEEASNCTKGINVTMVSDDSTELDRDNLTCHTKYEIKPTELRIHHQYIVWYLNVSNLLVTCTIPVGLLVFMNCRIATSLNEYRQRRPGGNSKSNEPTTIANKSKSSKTNTDIKQTFMLFSIVILFVICHSLRIITNIAEFLKFQKGEDGTSCKSQISLWEHICIPLSEFLLLFNSSANFIFYMLFDKAFQKILRDRFSTALNLCSRFKRPQIAENIPLSENKAITLETQEETLPRSGEDLNVTNRGSNLDTVVTVEKCI